MSFGKELRRILKSLEMTQVELSRKTGITPAAVSMIIDGKRDPSLSTIVKILKAIPVKFERLAVEELNSK